MEYYKTIGKSRYAKHLRKRTGKWTKAMANNKSRIKAKADLLKDKIQEQFYKVTPLSIFTQLIE